MGLVFESLYTRDSLACAFPPRGLARKPDRVFKTADETRDSRCGVLRCYAISVLFINFIEIARKNGSKENFQYYGLGAARTKTFVQTFRRQWKIRNWQDSRWEIKSSQFAYLLAELSTEIFDLRYSFRELESLKVTRNTFTREKEDVNKINCENHGGILRFSWKSVFFFFFLIYLWVCMRVFKCKNKRELANEVTR